MCVKEIASEGVAWIDLRKEKMRGIDCVAE
jgi:hypothetical protein